MWRFIADISAVETSSKKRRKSKLCRTLWQCRSVHVGNKNNFKNSLRTNEVQIVWKRKSNGSRPKCTGSYEKKRISEIGWHSSESPLITPGSWPSKERNGGCKLWAYQGKAALKYRSWSTNILSYELKFCLEVICTYDFSVTEKVVN